VTSAKRAIPIHPGPTPTVSMQDGVHAGCVEEQGEIRGCRGQTAEFAAGGHAERMKMRGVAWCPACGCGRPRLAPTRVEAGGGRRKDADAWVCSCKTGANRRQVYSFQHLEDR